MKQNAKYRRSCLLLLLVIAAALGWTFYRSLSYEYELSGAVTDLSAFYTEAYGYDVANTQEGASGSFTVTGDDPQFILSCPQGTFGSIGGIAIFLDSAWEGDATLPVQVFYAKEGESYAEKHSVKGELKAGEDAVLLPIPKGEYQSLRFDIDGDFQLEKIQGCSEQMKATAYVSQETIHTCMWYFPAIIIGCCLIFWAHGVRLKEGNFTAKAYVKNVFLGAEPSRDRAVYLDYLRVLAAVLVILAHACSPMVELADTSWKRMVLVCGLSLGLCCNLLYVMLSGTLLLSSKKEESVLSFYIRRASKVIIPLIAYYLLLLYLNDEVSFLPPRNIGAAFKRIVTGAPDVGPHLWLIYTIVALYLVTPFFKVMVQHMSDRLAASMAAVILVLNLLTTYLPLFGMTFGAATFLAGWEGVFLLGYIMTRQNERSGASRRNKIIMLAGVVGYVIAVAAVYLDSAQMNYVYNSAPTLVAASCGIFALFLQHKNYFKGKSNALVRLCSKYSYSVILIHWYALFVVVQGKLHITALRFGCIGGIIASVVVTFAACLAMAVVFDNTVVIVCNVLFEKVTGRLVCTRDEGYGKKHKCDERC
ncbi:MAG: acyltransferase [Lachnospiraceae bacterium]|nr:acyltransferase [Lachnospiraceae bacterium]